MKDETTQQAGEGREATVATINTTVVMEDSQGQQQYQQTSTPTTTAQVPVSPISPIDKPLPAINTNVVAVAATPAVEAEKGDDRTKLGVRKNETRRTSTPDIMKDLPPITPEKESGKWRVNSNTGKGGTPESQEKDQLQAAADVTAILAAEVSSLAIAPANPDSFAPGNEKVEGSTEESQASEEVVSEKRKYKEKECPASPPPPPPPPKDRIYLDTTPMTPLPSAPSSVAGTPPKRPPLKPGFDDSQDRSSRRRRQGSESSEEEDDPQSEIHSILEQFEPGHEGQPIAGANELSPSYPASPVVMSRTNSFNVLTSSRHPPRTSSLEALKDMSQHAMAMAQSTASSSHPLSRSSTSNSYQGNETEHQYSYSSPKTSNSSLPPTQGEAPLSPPPPPLPPRQDSLLPAPVPVPQQTQQIPHQPPPPELDPDLPFDFHRFLEQLRHRTADPVAKYLRSFLFEFSKKQWMVHEQVKIIHDFLHFIVGKMAQCEVWREVSEQEFDNAREGMEKLVMNRLYTQTFSPVISPIASPPPPPGRRGARRVEHVHAGRRGQHQEDVERDEVLAQKVRIYGWVREEHLDIEPVGDSGRRFLTLAIQELEKIKSYRAPRDKVICVMNCCKVIFGLIRHSHGDESADRFVPLLIYVVLRANPEHLVSNVQYILRFRNPDKLNGEAGYYLSSLMGAIQFIESLDRSSLTITDEEFERNVEAAVAAIAEKPPPPPPPPAEEKPLCSPSFPPGEADSAESSGSSAPRGRLRSLSPRAMTDAEEKRDMRRDEDGAGARNNHGTSNVTSAQQPTVTTTTATHEKNAASSSSDGEESAAVTGLLRTIQKPLSTIGRIFGDSSTSSSSSSSSSAPADQSNLLHAPPLTPQPGSSPVNSRSPAPKGHHHSHNYKHQKRNSQPPSAQIFSAEEAAARQASAEAAEAMRIQRAEHENVVGILASMFPGLDREIISDVVVQKEGRVGRAVDACLALSSG